MHKTHNTYLVKDETIYCCNDTGLEIIKIFIGIKTLLQFLVRIHSSQKICTSKFNLSK